MKEIIKQIMYGIQESKAVDKGEEYDRLSDKLDSIFNKLDDAHKLIFDEVYDCYSGMIAETETVFFKCGFKAAMALVLESAEN